MPAYCETSYEWATTNWVNEWMGTIKSTFLFRDELHLNGNRACWLKWVPSHCIWLAEGIEGCMDGWMFGITASAFLCWEDEDAVEHKSEIITPMNFCRHATKGMKVSDWVSERASDWMREWLISFVVAFVIKEGYLRCCLWFIVIKAIVNCFVMFPFFYLRNCWIKSFNKLQTLLLLPLPWRGCFVCNSIFRLLDILGGNYLDMLHCLFLVFYWHLFVCFFVWIYRFVTWKMRDFFPSKRLYFISKGEEILQILLRK